MSQLAIPLFIGTSLFQASTRVSAGEIAVQEAEVEASQEELGAIQREADRKQDLARAMASQIASAGARGIVAFEGSPLTILQEDIKAEQVATERDVFGSRISALTTRARGEVQRTQARQQAAIGLLGDATKLAAVI